MKSTYNGLHPDLRRGTTIAWWYHDVCGPPTTRCLVRMIDNRMWLHGERSRTTRDWLVQRNHRWWHWEGDGWRGVVHSVGVSARVDGLRIRMGPHRVRPRTRVRMRALSDRLSMVEMWLSRL
jgi:hypothetical protein